METKQNRTISVEEQAKFEIWNRDHCMEMSSADIYQVKEHIDELLGQTDLGFGISLQEAFDEKEEKFHIFMHSENWENHLSDEQLLECSKMGFDLDNEEKATENILNYLGLSIVFSHYEKGADSHYGN